MSGHCILLKSHQQPNTTLTDYIHHASLTEKMIEHDMSKNQEFMNMFMDKVVKGLTQATFIDDHTNSQFNYNTTV